MTDVGTSSGELVEVESGGANVQAIGTAELPGLRNEGERLKLKRDNAQLRTELAALEKPWWRKGSIVATLTAIIAAIVPVTTAVQAHYQKERELALQESKQANDIRVSYLDRLDKPGARLRTLRFVLATTNDPAMQSWAQQEILEAECDIAELAKQNEANPTSDPEEIRRRRELINESVLSNEGSQGPCQEISLRLAVPRGSKR